MTGLRHVATPTDGSPQALLFRRLSSSCIACSRALQFRRVSSSCIVHLPALRFRRVLSSSPVPSPVRETHSGRAASVSYFGLTSSCPLLHPSALMHLTSPGPVLSHLMCRSQRNSWRTCSLLHIFEAQSSVVVRMPKLSVYRMIVLYHVVPFSSRVRIQFL